MNAATQAPVAFVVGGGSGIGAASCKVFRERGWSVVVGDINLDAAEAVAGQVAGVGLHVDVARKPSVEQAADRIDQQFGGCDALVVAAAAFQSALPPEDLPLDLWEQVTNLCLRGTYVCDSVFGARMATRGRGAIVNIASLAALHSMPLHAYGPAKAAIIRLSENLAAEWGRSGVRVNCVTPGTTRTPRIAERLAKGERYTSDPADATALGRMVEPVHVAEAIEFLCSSRAAGITGANLLVDAGATSVAHWAMFGGPRPSRGPA